MLKTYKVNPVERHAKAGLNRFLPSLKKPLVSSVKFAVSVEENSECLSPLTEAEDLNSPYKSSPDGNCQAFFDFTVSQEEKIEERNRSPDLKVKFSNFPLETINEMSSDLLSSMGSQKPSFISKIVAEKRYKVNIRIPNQRLRETHQKLKSLSPRVSPIHLPSIKSPKSPRYPKSPKSVSFQQILALNPNN